MSRKHARKKRGAQRQYTLECIARLAKALDAWQPDPARKPIRLRNVVRRVVENVQRVYARGGKLTDVYEVFVSQGISLAKCTLARYLRDCRKQAHPEPQCEAVQESVSVNDNAVRAVPHAAHADDGLFSDGSRNELEEDRSARADDACDGERTITGAAIAAGPLEDGADSRAESAAVDGLEAGESQTAYANPGDGAPGADGCAVTDGESRGVPEDGPSPRGMRPVWARLKWWFERGTANEASP